MKLYTLHEGFYDGVQLRIKQFASACNRLGIDFCCLDTTKIDYSNLPVLMKGDLLYNLSRGSAYAEQLLINAQVTTFYIRPPVYPSLNSDTIKYTLAHSRSDILQPKTIFDLTTDRQLLEKYVAYLDGFPLIIKSAGSTRGIGTIKIDSWQNLISTADYLAGTGDRFIMRQFISASTGSRMIVLGNEVIAAADFEMNENDFRNAAVLSQVRYKQRVYPEAVKQQAVRAAHIAGTELAGIDFLEDKGGNFYLLEANFPTGYNGLIDVCGVDIPLQMVKFLIDKANRHD